MVLYENNFKETDNKVCGVRRHQVNSLLSNGLEEEKDIFCTALVTFQ